MGPVSFESLARRRLPALALMLALAGAVSAAPPKRVALVIGNGDYPGARLRNPVNDAQAIARRLDELGFTVISRLNADRDDMALSIQKFASQLGGDSVGLFYFAGHGVQARGRNYLIPVDAELSAERALKFEAIDVSAVLEDMEFAGNKLNIVILDACRNNPFERRFRGGSRGLAAIDAARGTMIAYATSPGSVAADGSGANGLYTEELLKALGHPGLKAEEVFKRVRIAVSDRSHGQQVPWESSSLTGDFVFNAADGAPGGMVPSITRSGGEVLFWDSVKDSRDPRAYEEYLNQYPDGTFAGLARLRIETLSESRSGAAAGTAGDHAARIAELLDAAQRDIADRRLTSPPGENAVAKLRDVLALDPDNVDARQGLIRVVDRYVTWANTAMDRAELDKAAGYLQRAESVAPEAASLLLAKARLADEKNRLTRDSDTQRQTEQEAARAAEAERVRQLQHERERRLAEHERLLAQQSFRREFGSEGRVIAASEKGITVELEGQAREIRDFAGDFCQRHAKRSSLVSSNPITHEQSFVCY